MSASLKNGARWQDLPDRYPSPATCRRRHKAWTEARLLIKTWETLIRMMDRQKLLDWSQAMGDGAFSPAKKGGLEVAKTKKGKGTKLVLMTEAHGIPISAMTTSARDAEVNTIETLVDVRVTKKRPKRLLYDKAADADWLRDALAHRAHRTGDTSSRRPKETVSPGRARSTSIF